MNKTSAAESESQRREGSKKPHIAAFGRGNAMSTDTIVVRKPAEDELASLQVMQWPIWEGQPSTFDWHYDERETCYILEGKATVKVGDEKTSFGSGDLVIFPEGLECVWEIEALIRKHYRLG